VFTTIETSAALEPGIVGMSRLASADDMPLRMSSHAFVAGPDVGLGGERVHLEPLIRQGFQVVVLRVGLCWCSGGHYRNSDPSERREWCMKL
jgi:hypothetical protein